MIFYTVLLFLSKHQEELAYYLSVKKAPDRIQLLKQLYEDELLRALNEDGQRASVYISPQTYFGDGV